MSRSDCSADEVDAHVGRRLRQRRIALGISQEQLGEALGLTFQQIQKYEKAQNRISAGRLCNLSAILSVSIGYFFEELPNDQRAARIGPSDGQAADNGGRTPSEAEMQAFLASPEGLSLTAAFMLISDPETRRRIVELVKTISDHVEPIGGAGV
jgi:transcriptional regulator with XRE-family HTH domain